MFLRVLLSGCLLFCAPWARAQDFIEDCATKKIGIVAAYPNLMDRPQYRTEMGRQTAERILGFYRDQGVEVLSSYEQSLLPPGEFFDTEYHLRTEPAVRRTRLLALQFLPWLKKSGMVPAP